jgi:hypothetical protein
MTGRPRLDVASIAYCGGRRCWPGRTRWSWSASWPGETLLGLALRLTQPTFIQPTVALAAATAALSVGVGFLPVRGAATGLDR